MLPRPLLRRGRARVAALRRRHQKVIVVDLDDMFRERTVDPPTKDLIAWTRAIQKGCRIKCDAQEYALKKASQAAANVIFDTEFVRKHAGLPCYSRLARLQVAGR